MGIKDMHLKFLIDVQKKKISLETGHDGEQVVGQEEKQPEEIQFYWLRTYWNRKYGGTCKKKKKVG